MCQHPPLPPPVFHTISSKWEAPFFCVRLSSRRTNHYCFQGFYFFASLMMVSPACYCPACYSTVQVVFLLSSRLNVTFALQTQSTQTCSENVAGLMGGEPSFPHFHSLWPCLCCNTLAFTFNRRLPIHPSSSAQSHIPHP